MLGRKKGGPSQVTRAPRCDRLRAEGCWVGAAAFREQPVGELVARDEVTLPFTGRHAEAEELHPRAAEMAVGLGIGECLRGGAMGAGNIIPVGRVG